MMVIRLFQEHPHYFHKIQITPFLDLCPTDPQTLKSHKPNENHETFVKSEISNLKKLSKPYANHETFVRCGVERRARVHPRGNPKLRVNWGDFSVVVNDTLIVVKLKLF